LAFQIVHLTPGLWRWARNVLSAVLPRLGAAGGWLSGIMFGWPEPADNLGDVLDNLPSHRAQHGGQIGSLGQQIGIAESQGE
jgi:hypothetical protein